jgi:hypothetical protein
MDYQISKKIEPEIKKVGVTTSYRIVSNVPKTDCHLIITKRNLF